MNFTFLMIVLLGWVSLIGIGIFYKLSLREKATAQEASADLPLDQVPSRLHG